MNIQYQSLEIWHLAFNFVLHVYKVVEHFPQFEDNNITSQLRRAATCLPLNIAEGSGARSAKIFLNYLIFANRSAREIETLLLLCKELKYISEEEYNESFEKLNHFVRKLISYMNYLEKDHIGTNRKTDLSHFYRQNKSYVKPDLGALT